MSNLREDKLQTIRRAASLVELRMRLSRALRALPSALTVALAIAAGTVAVRKALPHALSERRAWIFLGVALAIVVLTETIAFLLRLPPRAGTVALDRHHKLSDRLTNALAFSAMKERTPLMELAIDDACERADQLSPSAASPITIAPDMAGPVAIAAGVAAIAALYVPPKVAPPPPQQQVIDALSMNPDDLELFRDAAKQMERQDQSPEVKAAIEEFNKLIKDIADKRLDRTEAFRRMEQIERELMKGAEADAKSFDEALKQTAEELKKSDLAKPIGESLEKKDFDKAKKDLKELAASLKGKKKPDKAQLEKLQKALQKAAQRKKEALAAINAQRAELREQLLSKKKDKKDNPDAGPKQQEEEKLLKKKERELERLDREAEQKERAMRQLDKLDRDLAKAAEDLMKDLGMSADDLEKAIEDINRMQDEQMSDKEKEDLRQRLQELRELLRQQGQAGKQRMSRLLKFGKRARGGGKGQKGQQGQQGQQGQDQDDGEGQEGQEGQGKEGQGKEGQGQGQQWVIGPGGKRILISKGSGGQGEMPGQGQGPGQGQQGQGQGQDGPGNPGKGIGTSHDANVKGARSDLKGQTTDVQAQGLDSHQGPSNSEVILAAAERGFKGKGYKKVFTDYHTVAEQQINKDKIPDGYRFYVHRYFQLIRPRE